MDDYAKTKCNTDYHDSCKDAFKDCKSDKAKTLCLKTCGPQNCDKRKVFSSSKNE